MPPVPPGIREIDPDAEAARLAEARKPAPVDYAAWLSQVKVHWYASDDTPEAQRFVEMTHLPTGTKASGLTEAEAVADLATALVAKGAISINSARFAMRLPPVT